MNELEQKRILLERILAEIGFYFQNHGPMPYRLLAQKYGVKAKPFGGIDAVVNELCLDGSIEPIILRTGRKLFAMPERRRA